jgi:hypothetical protein
MLGPDGLGGRVLDPQFGQDQAADALRPGPILAALTEQAVAGTAFLTDDRLTGARHGSRRCWWPSSPVAATPSSPTPRPAASPRAAAPASSPTTSSPPSC